LETLRDDDFYRVAEFSACNIAPAGGPRYLSWSFERKHAPSAEEVAEMLRKVQQEWSSIAADTVANITRPLRFTGRKSRRLLVEVVGEGDPPWGTWVSLARDETRRRFTELRTNVNNLIEPHMVDHIDFVQTAAW